MKKSKKFDEGVVKLELDYSNGILKKAKCIKSTKTFKKGVYYPVTTYSYHEVAAVNEDGNVFWRRDSCFTDYIPL